MHQLFPEVEPYNSFRLKVSDIHELYVEEFGNPHGQPAVSLHGGPGAGMSAKQRRYYDLKHYRLIIFDQRGAGKSTPHASLEANTTWDLVSDIEKVREHLKIDRWLVEGGSWGSTLSLAYAQTHPERVTALIVRGIFLCRPEEIKWFYQEGAHWIFPDFWEDYVAQIPPEQRQDMVASYYKLLTHSDEKIRLRVAKAWSGWEGSTLSLIPNLEKIEEFTNPHLSLSLARIECHYFMNDAWLKPNQLLKDAHKLKGIPGWITHGRYDVVCPVKNAWDLHRAWPEAHLEIIKDAGHARDEAGIVDSIIRATEQFKGVK